MEFSWNPNTKCKEVFQSSISKHPFVVPSFSKISQPQVKLKKMVSSVFYNPCPSRLASRVNILSHFFKFLRSLYLSRMILEFSITCVFYYVWGKVLNFGVHIHRKCIESRHFYSCSSSPIKTQKFLKVCFPQQQKAVERTLICFIKIQSGNMKMNWSIRLFIFCMICNFSKCKMTLQFCK